jgi:hypothetical protein
MTEFEFKISSREEFIKNLRESIDNEKYFFSLPKKKFSGFYTNERFELSENRIKYKYMNYYKILGQIDDDKVKIRLKTSDKILILLIFYCVIFIMFLVGFLNSEDTWIFLIFLSILIINSLTGVHGYLKRKDQLYHVFEKMTNNKKTVQNNGEHAGPL